MNETTPEHGTENRIPPKGGSGTALPIQQHEGKKYLRLIHSAAKKQDGTATACLVDVYSVLEAFGVTCPARQHAIKKLLCAGTRGKGSEREDLVGALAALSRAIELQEQREKH